MSGRLPGAVVTLLAAVLLASCTAPLSEGLTDDGDVRRVVFPPLSSAIRPEGIFPDRAVLYEVEPGVRKSHLLHWSGPPNIFG